MNVFSYRKNTFVPFFLCYNGVCVLAEEIVKLKKQLYNLYVKHTSMSYEEIERMMDRDRFLSPHEAVNCGLIDQVTKYPACGLNHPLPNPP